MNIHAKKWDKVVFSTFNAGYESQKCLMKKLNFVVGRIYFVDHTVVHSWYTDVYLQEFPNQAFNSVFFEDYKEKK